MSFYFLAFFIYAKNKEVEKMLHLDGRPWALKPYKDYKNQPEKYQEKAVGIRPKFGEFPSSNNSKFMTSISHN